MIQVHLFCGTTFPHSIRFATGVQKPTSTASRTRSWREPLFLIPLGQAGTRGRKRARPAELLHCFVAEPVFLVPFELRSAAKEPGGAPAGASARCFLTEPLFLIPSIHRR